MEKKRDCTYFMGVGTNEKRFRVSESDSFTNKNSISDSGSSRCGDSPDLNLARKERSETKIKTDKSGEEQVSDSESVSSALSNEPTKIMFSEDGLVMLEEGDEEHGFVKSRFVEGLGFLGKDVSIAGIHKNSHSGYLRQARLLDFQIYSEATANRRGGDANVRNAWRGISRDEVCGIIRYGFGLCATPEIANRYGVGLYLYPEDSSINSAISSVMDKNGIQHVVFCRVIMGNMEQVPLGSEQFHPSSEEFDSGVDDLLSPKRYIVWSTHMNTHILPEYIVSFKVHTCSTGVAWRKIEVPVRKPTSAWMPLPRLISLLSRILPPSSIGVIKRHHNDFRGKRITREYLIKRVREIAGDELLIAAIKSFQAQQLEAAVTSLSEESTCTGTSIN